jgi:hypothetical protein
MHEITKIRNRLDAVLFKNKIREIPRIFWIIGFQKENTIFFAPFSNFLCLSHPLIVFNLIRGSDLLCSFC